MLLEHLKRAEISSEFLQGEQTIKKFSMIFARYIIYLFRNIEKEYGYA